MFVYKYVFIFKWYEIIYKYVLIKIIYIYLISAQQYFRAGFCYHGQESLSEGINYIYLENWNCQKNISPKDGHKKGQKRYGPNRRRRY